MTHGDSAPTMYATWKVLKVNRLTAVSCEQCTPVIHWDVDCQYAMTLPTCTYINTGGPNMILPACTDLLELQRLPLSQQRQAGALSNEKCYCGVPGRTLPPCGQVWMHRLSCDSPPSQSSHHVHLSGTGSLQQQGCTHSNSKLGLYTKCKPLSVQGYTQSQN